MVSTLTEAREVLTTWKAGLDSADERKDSRRRQRLVGCRDRLGEGVPQRGLRTCRGLEANERAKHC